MRNKIADITRSAKQIRNNSVFTQNTLRDYLVSNDRKFKFRISDYVASNVSTLSFTIHYIEINTLDCFY